MSNETQQQLDRLKKALGELEPAINNIKKADSNTQILVELVNDMYDEYNTQLKGIGILNAQSNKEINSHLTSSITETTNKINEIIITLSKSSNDFSFFIKKFQKDNKDLTENADTLIKKIDSIDFPERLNQIEETVQATITNLNETRESTIEELQKASEIITKADFDGRFKKLQNSIDSSVKSNEALSNSIEKQKLPEKIDGFEKNITKKLEVSISELQKNTKQISTETTKSILDLNIPIRIDKLDSTISSINQGIQTTQQRIGDLERNIKDDVHSKQKELISKIESAENATKQRIDNSEKEFIKMFEKISKENRILKFLVFFSICLTVIVITFRIIPYISLLFK